MKNTKQLHGDLGQHWTPEDVVKLMLSLKQNTGTTLEPSAGSGRFMRALPDAIGVEIDASVIPKDLAHRYEVMSFFDFRPAKTFDTIIGNPPYVNGKLLDNMWFGSWQPSLPITANAYLHFIDRCIELMHDGSELIFIVPSSLMSETSKGSKLRKKMCRDGAFTHLIFAEEIVKWDKAAVNTVIFRWQKGLKQGKIKTNRGDKLLVENEGFVWLLDFQPSAVIGDFFKVTVGAAPSASALRDAQSSSCKDHYIRFGQKILVDESNYDTWPRPRYTGESPKIFFIGGPTRKGRKFFAGSSGKHMDHALIPHKKMDHVKAADLLDEWFNQHGENLGLIIGGRWNVGVRQLQHCPIDETLHKALVACLK